MKPCSIVQRLPTIDFSASAASYAASTSSIAASPTACVATRHPMRFSSLTTSVYGAAFEAAVDAEFHTANAQPLVAFIGLDVRGGNRGAHFLGAVGAVAHQLVHA